MFDMETMLVTSWELRQFGKFAQEQPDAAARALRKLLDADLALRWTLTISAYRDGLISLAKAAELLQINALELRQKLVMLGIPILLGPGTLEEAQAEIAAIRQWRNSDAQSSATTA